MVGPVDDVASLVNCCSEIIIIRTDALGGFPISLSLFPLFVYAARPFREHILKKGRERTINMFPLMRY